MTLVGYVALVMALSFVCGALTAGISVYVWTRPDAVEEEEEDDETYGLDPRMLLHPCELPQDLPGAVLHPVTPFNPLRLPLSGRK